MLFHTDLLKWYLNHGLVASNVTLMVQYEKCRPFERFVEEITTARRMGDRSKEYKLFGEMSKLIGNSGNGTTITNLMKQERVAIVPPAKFAKYMKSPGYKGHEDLENGFEFRLKKMIHTQKLPIQVGFAVYQQAKLRMLEFHYDFVDKYIDRSDYQLCQTDADSNYGAFSGVDFDSLVKPHLRDEYLSKRHKWLCRNDTPENNLYDKRTPGLFKIEYEGNGIISLAAKMYYCFGENKDKSSSKGINRKQNQLTKEMYMQALHNDSSQTFQHKGFRVRGNKMTTYTILKTGMKLFNDKRKRIGYDTLPLEI